MRAQLRVMHSRIHHCALVWKREGGGEDWASQFNLRKKRPNTRPTDAATVGQGQLR